MMHYRMIVADDEVMLLKLIRHLGHFEELGIEVIDECTDGETALQSILQNRPDFVLTDIQMPVFDGLQIVEAVSKSEPNILFALLSGYRVFEYAQSAVKLNVVDYLLKPVDEEQLNAVLRRLCQMTEERRQLAMRQESLQGYEQAEQADREDRFWRCVLDARDAGKSLALRRERIEADYGIRLQGSQLRILLLDLGLSDGIQIELTPLLGKLETLMEHCFACKAQVLHKVFHGVVLMLLCFDEGQTLSVRSAISAFLSECRDLHEVYGENQLALGMSTTGTDSSKLPGLLSEADFALVGRLVLPGSPMIRYEQVRDLPHGMGEPDFWQRTDARLSEALRALDEEAAAEVIRRVRRLAEAQPYCSPADIKRAYIHLRDTLVFPAPEEQQSALRQQLANAMRSAVSLPQGMSLVGEVILRYIRSQREALSRKEQKPAELAEDYIRCHYMEGISLESVAEAAGVSAAHLSRIFKEFYGKGFNEYLTALRLEESKRLLAESRMSIREVASAVGYTDEKYFSRLFRKELGIKPTDYRRLYGK